MNFPSFRLIPLISLMDSTMILELSAVVLMNSGWWYAETLRDVAYQKDRHDKNLCGKFEMLNLKIICLSIDLKITRF